MRKQLLLLFIPSVILASAVANAANAKINVCTMTFNSSDEKAVFQKKMPNTNIIELVPESKDPDWFKKACASKISCDALVISGHFGGLFFGEAKSSLLMLNELSKASCDNSCDGVIGKVKSVYLMGCNTLATKVKDHRSVTEYLSVLTGDGFPREIAEVVAATRYLDFGTSIADQMQAIFPSAQLIFGFDSTGPVGAQAAPLLSKAIRNSKASELSTGRISSNALRDAFSGLSYQITAGGRSEYSNFRCEIRNRPTEALKTMKAAQVRGMLDILLFDTGFADFSKLDITQEVKTLLNRELLRTLKLSKGLVGLQSKTVTALRKLNLISDVEAKDLQEKLFKSTIQAGLDYVSADQACDLAAGQDLLLDEEKYTDIRSYAPDYIGFLAQCFQRKTLGVNSLLHGEMTYATTPSVRREVMRSFAKANSNLPLDDGGQAYSCVAALTMQPISAVGDYWNCLTGEESTIHISACSLAADKNTDTENSDDMKFFCWDRLRFGNRMSQSECLTLARSFKIKGNQIKMNWNCQNRLDRN